MERRHLANTSERSKTAAMRTVATITGATCCLSQSVCSIKWGPPEISTVKFLEDARTSFLTQTDNSEVC